MKPYRVTAKVELFPQEGGWHYARVPKSITKELKAFQDRGLIAITATLGKTVWNTSLLPMGDGAHFVVLSNKVRQAEKVKLGDKIELTFVLRNL